MGLDAIWQSVGLAGSNATSPLYEYAPRASAIYSTAKELDPKKLLALSDKHGGIIPHAAIAALITESPHSWVQIGKVKKVAPEIERLPR